MADATLIGIYEIAELAGVTASAVANWRKRFADFPAPLAELKSGPVFGESQIKLWLARREQMTGVLMSNFSMTSVVAVNVVIPPNYGRKSMKSFRVFRKNLHRRKSLGLCWGAFKAEMRAYLGVIARAFDKGFDAAVILTKGTKSLAKQTLIRVQEDFEEFIDGDQVLARTFLMCRS